MDLAKVEAGGIKLDIEAVNPKGLIEECMALTQALAEPQGIIFKAPLLENGLPTILADRTRFKQVLLNLTSNAVKYNHTGGTVTLDCAPLNNAMIRFTVTDTGTGIPVDKHGDLFEPFKRLDAENGTVRGTGIGLTITKNLIEMMQGSIGFNSVPGQGSTFWVDLPVASDITAGNG